MFIEHLCMFHILVYAITGSILYFLCRSLLSKHPKMNFPKNKQKIEDKYINKA